MDDAPVLLINGNPGPVALAERALGRHLVNQCDRVRIGRKFAPRSEVHWTVRIGETRFRVVISLAAE